MHIYFSGLGGVGVGPLAMLAQDAGHTVEGSDLNESPVTDLLKERDIKISLDHSGENISKVHHKDPIDWFVYTAALPAGHPELEFAKSHNIRISKRDECLNKLLDDLKLKMVAVSGTHGKTTTTAMIIWLFKQLKIPVSYSVGTTLSFGPPAQYQDGSKFFIYEADEFDKNMLKFKPHLSVIPSLDYDHPDTYPTKNDYIEAFKQFAEQSKMTITWQSIADKLSSDAHLFVIPDERDFDQIKLAGQHNRRNAWLAATAINRLELVKNNLDDWNRLLKVVSDFPGSGRRFEKLAENLYTDYAHHPAEIQTTIAAAKELNPNVVVVYQPHQNIRQHEMLETKAYTNCFAGLKKLYWLPTYLSREDNKLKVLKPKKLVKDIKNVDIELADMNAKLSQKIKDHQKAGDLVLAMSAGDLDPWLRKNFAD